ncbi:MAG: hypothetical protein AAGA56_06895 [Myxococcota bacterium]
MAYLSVSKRDAWLGVFSVAVMMVTSLFTACGSDEQSSSGSMAGPSPSGPGGGSGPGVGGGTGAANGVGGGAVGVGGDTGGSGGIGAGGSGVGGGTGGGCTTGTADCDGLPGCEVQLASDVMHCGECGNACPAGCTSGKCDEALLTSFSGGIDVVVTDGEVAIIDAPGDVTNWPVMHELLRVPLDGSPSSVLAVEPNPIEDIAIDATHAYYVNRVAGLVRRVPLDGSQPATTLAKVDGANRVAVHGGVVAVGTFFASNDLVGTVPAQGGPFQVLSPSPNWVPDIDLDGSAVYYFVADSDGDPLERVPLVGGPVTTIATIGSVSGRLVVGSTDIFARDIDGLIRLPKAGGAAVPLPLLPGHVISFRSPRIDGITLWTMQPSTITDAETFVRYDPPNYSPIAGVEAVQDASVTSFDIAGGRLVYVDRFRDVYRVDP